MSVAQRAARGALWTIIASIGGRAIGVAGTLVMTRFLDPDAIGEVSDATILCMTASWLTIWGWGQYAIVRGRGDEAREVTWHATVMFVVPGIISLGAIALVGGKLTPLLDAPHAAVYIPGMALAVFIKRLGAIPERMLARQLKFKAVGIQLAVGEATYTAIALALASAGWGGMAIVVANIVQATVQVAIMATAVGWRTWLAPTKLRWARIKDMVKFGAPLGIGLVAHNASRYWDNLTVSHFFGPGPTGAYNMAYNLADIPAIQVGEQVAQVMLPSLSELPPERRADAFERSTALLSLIIFPLAVGLGLVANPLIRVILPANKWQEVAPLLTVLTCLSVFRPMSWMMSAYMEAMARTNRLMYVEIGKLIILIGAIVLLAPFGLRVASVAVGLSFGTSALGGIAMIVREGVSPRRLFRGFAQPLVACALMGAAVWAIDRGLTAAGEEHAIILLFAEIIGGALVYVAAVLVIARKSSRELLALIPRALGRRGATA